MAEKNSLWKNIRNKAKQNRRTGATPKKPTAEMLRQERKIKAQKADGGLVNTLEGDLISKVIMNRNRNKDFVQRAYAVGEYPESNMFVQPDANEFGQKNSHLMGWGEDESGQAYMYPEVMNPNNEAIKVPNQYADYISSTGYKKATGIPYAVGGRLYPDGGPTKSLVQPPVLLDDNIIYPTDNPYMPGVNKDILDADYDSYMRWREGFINTEGVTPEEFFQTYPSRQEWERKNFDPANLHNGVSLAQGGPTGGDDDPFKSTLNEGVVVSKPAQDWVSSWVQDPEFANRLNKNFPDHASKLSKKFYGYKEAKQRAAESNLKSINKAIPGVISDIYDTQFLYNTNPETNSQLLDLYRASYNDPEYDKFFEKNMSKNPQGFTDEQGRIVITNAANDQYGPESVSVHELMHKTGLYDDETFDRTFRGKFLTPSQDRLDKDFNRGEMYPFLMQMRFDNNFQPGETITPERLKQIKESGYKNHLFKYYTDDEISKYLNTLASNQTQAPMQYAAQGGYVDGDKDKKKKTRVYTDPRKFRIAQQNYNDSLAVSNQSQILIDAYNRARGTNTGLSGTEYEKVKSDNPNPNAAFSRLNKPKPISRYNINITDSPRPNLDNIKIYKEPEEIPVFRKPEIEYLPSKPYKGESTEPSIIPTPPKVEFGQSNMNNFFEGTYEKYKRSPYEDPMYRVWISGKGQQVVPESEFKKLSDQYLLKDLEAPDPGGNLYDKPKATGGHMNPYMYYAGGPMQYKRGGVLEDVGKLWLNFMASPFEQISGNNFVNFNYNNKGFANAAAVMEGVAGAGTDIAGSVFLGPAYGMGKGAIQGVTKNLGHSQEYQRGADKWANKTGQIASSAGNLTSGIMSGNPQQIIGGAGQVLGTLGSEFGSKELNAAGQLVGMGSRFVNPSQGMPSTTPSVDSSINNFQSPVMYPDQMLNQGLSFTATGGNINNNSLNLQNSMRGKYNSYKRKYSRGGTFQKFGINEIPDSAGLHHQNAYGGVPIGKDAMAEGGEFVLDGNYVVSDQVDGMNTQTDEFGRTMAENLKRDLSKYTMRDLNSKNREGLRRPMDPLAQETINQIKQKAMMETEMARAEAQAKEQERQAMVDGALQYAAAGGKLNKDITKIVEEEYAAAYGGQINPKKYKGLNMPGYSKGGKLPKEVLRARVESHMSPQEADAYVNQYGEGGGIHIKESKKGTFTAAATKHGKSVQEFARQVLANKGNYSAAMVKKANFARNAAGWKHAHGGPVVSNVNQGFGLYAQNRGGMMMAQGGNMYANGGPPYDLPGMFDMTANPGTRIIESTGETWEDPGTMYEYEAINNYLNNLNTPNYVDNQGNTSSILSRMKDSNKKNLINPLDYPNLFTPYKNPVVSELDKEMINLTDMIGWGSGTNPVRPLTEERAKLFDDWQLQTPEPPTYGAMTEEEAIANGYKPTILPEKPLTLENKNTGPYSNRWSLNPQPESLMTDENGNVIAYDSAAQSFAYKPEAPLTKVNQPKQPNDGLGIPDYISMAAQAAGPLSQLYYGLKGPDDVNYERIKADKIDPYRAITLANEESRRAQDTASYNLRQNAPTSGSYMSNMRGLGLQAGKQRGAQTAGIQYEADTANTQMQNQVNAQNAQIAMQEQIDRLQEKDAARTNVTEGLSGVGSSTANMIRDYRTNQINKTIANNIGTGNTMLVKNPDGTYSVVMKPNSGNDWSPTPYNDPYKQSAPAVNTGANVPSTNVTPAAAPAANTTTKSVEFTDNITDKKTGDAFRAWVNKNYPKYAKEKDLWVSGEYNNSYIKKAWDEYGKEYLGQ